MKKSKLAIGMIAFLGIGYTGVSWHTGNVIEENVDTYIEQFNEQLSRKQKDFDIVIKADNYQKNIFSTKLNLNIELIPKNNPDEKIDILSNEEITIYHGPFPLAALLKGTFSPQMVWIENEMKQQTSPKLWEFAGNQPFYSGYISINYDGLITGKFESKPIKILDNKSNIKHTLDISKGSFMFALKEDEIQTLPTFTLTIDKLEYHSEDKTNVVLNNINAIYELSLNDSVNQVKLNAGVDNIDIDVNNDMNTQAKINNLNINGFYDIDIDLKGFYKFKNIKVNTKLEKFSIIPSKQHSVEINNMSFDQDYRLNENNTINASIRSDIESVYYGKQNLGSGELALAYSGIDAQKIGYVLDPKDKYILNPSPNEDIKVSLDYFKWKNTEGSINTKAKVITQNDYDLSERVDIEKIKNLSIDFDIPIKVLARFKAQLDSTNQDLDDVKAEKIANEYNNLVMMAEMVLGNNPYIDIKGDVDKNLSLQLEYAKDREEVILNGEHINKEDFFSELQQLN